jgi:hypothetical protein
VRKVGFTPDAPPPRLPAFPRPSAPSPPPSKRADVMGWLRVAGNLFAVACGLAFVVLACFGLSALNFTSKLLDGEVYKDSLRKQEIYTRFPDLFAEQMALSQNSLGKEARIDFTGVGPADWKLIAQQLVTPEWIQSQVENLIDEAMAAARPGATPPDLKIAFTDIIQRMSGDAGFSIYKQVIKSKRSCSLDDFFDIIDWMDQAPGINLHICNIPPDLTEFAAFIAGYNNGDEMIKDLLKALPQAVPGDLSLSDFFVLRMDRVGGAIRVLRIVAGISLVLAFLALLGTFASPLGRTWKGGFLFWGAPLALAGLVGLVTAVLVPLALVGSFAGAFRGSISPGVTRVILQLGAAVVGPGATALGWQAGGLLLVGLGLCAVPILIWGLGKLMSH